MSHNIFIKSTNWLWPIKCLTIFVYLHQYQCRDLYGYMNPYQWMARLMKKHSLLSMINGMVVDLPAPANISYLWNFGSLLGVCLVVQIVTGIFLAMHYAAHVDLAFSSVEHILWCVLKISLYVGNPFPSSLGVA